MSKHSAPMYERVLNKTEVQDGGCWLWLGSTTNAGYGILKNPYPENSTSTLMAHRIMYAHFVGPLLDDKELDHTCFNRNCVNPDHLEQVTHAENMHRAKARNMARTECKYGHPWSVNEAFIMAKGVKTRRCKACNVISVMKVKRNRAKPK